MARRHEILPGAEVFDGDESASAEPLLTSFGVYLKQAGVGFRSFAYVTGRDHGTIANIARGDSLPDLPTAYLIEICTRGVVPMETHLGSPVGRMRMQNLWNSMPQESIERLGIKVSGLDTAGAKPGKAAEDVDAEKAVKAAQAAVRAAVPLAHELKLLMRGTSKDPEGKVKLEITQAQAEAFIEAFKKLHAEVA